MVSSSQLLNIFVVYVIYVSLERSNIYFLIVYIVLGKGQKHCGGVNVAQVCSFAEVIAMTNNLK